MKLNRILATLTYSVAVLGLASHAQAAQATAQFKAKIKIVAECKILSTADIDFGTHGLIANNVDAEGNISVRCTPGTPYTLALGVSGNATQSARLMQSTAPNSTASPVTYQIYLNSSRTTLWGVNTGFTVSGTGTGVSQNHPTYGRTPAGAYTVGEYQDIVTATLTY